MPVNFNALRQTGPSGFAEGLAQGQEEQRANALAQQKMGQEQEMNALRMQQLRGAIGEQESTRKKQSLLDKTGMFRERLLRAPTPEAAREIVKMQYADPDIGPVISQGGSLEQSLAEVSDDPKLFDRYKQQEAMGMSEWMKSQMPKAVGGSIYLPSENRFIQPPAAPEKPPAPPSMVGEYQFAKTPEGGGYVGSYEKFVRDRAVAARPPGAPAQPSAPVAVVDPVTGKPMYVSREKAMGMAPASAQESLPPKEIQKREAALPQATSAVQGFESKSDKFIADLKALRDDPGLENITGAIYGRTGSVTREGSRAQALYDKVVAKGGFQALQDLRDASKTGGALGNVSNQEGKQLTASFSAIDRRQSAEDVKAAIDQAIADIEGSKARMREAYDQTYSYKAAAPGAAPTAPKPGAGALSPAEEAELAQLRKRFGK